MNFGASKPSMRHIRVRFLWKTVAALRSVNDSKNCCALRDPMLCQIEFDRLVRYRRNLKWVTRGPNAAREDGKAAKRVTFSSVAFHRSTAIPQCEHFTWPCSKYEPETSQSGGMTNLQSGQAPA